MTELLPPLQFSLQNEILWRGRVYEHLQMRYEPGMTPPHVLQDLKVYSGAAGLWCDRPRTTRIVETGVCVAFLHTGQHYNDSIVGDLLVYHYPETNRSGSTDSNEIDAARSCLHHRVPIFIILPGRNLGTRTVRLGWIIGDMPEEKAFLVSMRDQDPGRVGSSPK